MVSGEGGGIGVTLPGRVGGVLAALSNFTLWLAALALVAMMVHVTADVVLKITLNWPVAGTLEIVSYIYMVACTFLPLAHLQASRSLIVVEFFTQKLDKWSLLKLETFIAPLSVAYLGTLAIVGAMRAYSKMDLGETQDATYFELPVWPMRWVFAAALAVTALVALHQFITDVRRVRAGPGADRSGPKLGDLGI
jgi:TRAP-type C4-dicarboxylate transport system permease small subunit